MRRFVMRRILALSGVLSAGCPGKPNDPPRSAPAPAPVATVSEPVKSESMPSNPIQDAWPAQPGATWPRNCTLEDLGVHPSEPWLTLACSDTTSENSGAAVLVIDARAGVLRSVSPVDNSAGWRGEGGLVLWNDDGDRLCSNIETNAIGLFERGELVASALPDDTRDSPVDYAWVGDRIYTDLGDFYDPSKEDGYIRAPSRPLQPIDWTIETFKWVPDLNAVVGVARRPDADSDELVAFAPQRDQEIYREPLGEYLYRLTWSPNRRFIAVRRTHSQREPVFKTWESVDVVDARRGRRVRAISDVQGWPLIGDDGTVVLYRVAASSLDRVEVVRPDGTRMTLHQHAGARSASLAPPLALSPDGFGLAQLMKNETIAVFDLTTGRELLRFEAELPGGLASDHEAGVVWVSPDRIAAVAREFVKIWSLEGAVIAEFVVPKA